LCGAEGKEILIPQRHDLFGAMQAKHPKVYRLTS